MWCLRASAIGLTVALAAAGCGTNKDRHEPIVGLFSEDFAGPQLRPHWYDTGGDYHIVDGRLAVASAYNRPLWLRRKLPADVVVELDVSTNSPEGDIKLELFGNGRSFESDRSPYDASGYVFVFGGWTNAYSIIGRHGEQGDKVKAQRPPAEVVVKSTPEDHIEVIPGRSYHFRITRQNGHIDWQINGESYLSWTDPVPLSGDEYAYLGLNNWRSEVYFDNLTIRPAAVRTSGQ